MKSPSKAKMSASKDIDLTGWSLEKIGVFFHASKQGVAKWKKKGAPIHSARLMCGFIAAQKKVEPDIRIRLSEISRELGPPDEPKDEQAKPARTGGAAGAAAALRRLEGEEIACFNRMQDEIESKTPDPSALKMARDAWIKTSESLRKFDLMVEASRRDAGELLPRAEWARLSRSIVFWWRHGINRAEDEVCERLVNLPDSVAAWKVLHTYFVAKWGEAFAFACQRDSPISLPQWAVAEVMDSLRVPLVEISDPPRVYFDPY